MSGHKLYRIPNYIFHFNGFAKQITLLNLISLLEIPSLFQQCDKNLKWLVTFVKGELSTELN